jgi:putative hydrolase of HD superfamily
MNEDRFKMQLEFLTEIDKLKQILRNTILMDASRRENDAEHTWHMAVCAVLFSEYSNATEIDMLKVLKMVLIHDIVEIDAGDTFAYDVKGHEDKEVREQKAANRLFGLLPEDQCREFAELWHEFDKLETPEAKYASAIDRFMPIYHNYKTKGRQWREFKITKKMVLERNKTIEEGSKELWKFVERLVDDAVDKGYLLP